MRPVALLSTAAPLVAAQTLCGQYDTLSAGQYLMRNNKWGQDFGSGRQCVTKDGLSGGSISWHAIWEWHGGEANVKSYPNTKLQIPNKSLVSEIATMPTKANWSYIYAGPRMSAGVSYDFFTAADPAHDTWSGDYEVMIWLAKYGWVQPIGLKTDTVHIAGLTWDLWFGTIGSQQTFSFVAQPRVMSFEADAIEFFRYLEAKKKFQASSQYLLSFEFGTEPLTGGPAVFHAHSWSASIGTTAS